MYQQLYNYIKCIYIHYIHIDNNKYYNNINDDYFKVNIFL